jgi:hypothetical protein
MRQESEQLAAGFSVLYFADFVVRNFVLDFGAAVVVAAAAEAVAEVAAVAAKFVAELPAAAAAAEVVAEVGAAAVPEVHSVDAKPQVQTVQHCRVLVVELVAFVGA